MDVVCTEYRVPLLPSTVVVHSVPASNKSSLSLVSHVRPVAVTASPPRVASCAWRSLRAHHPRSEPTGPPAVREVLEGSCRASQKAWGRLSGLSGHVECCKSDEVFN